MDPLLRQRPQSYQESYSITSNGPATGYQATESSIESCNETEAVGSYNTERRLTRRTPLPAGQVTILLYLRFCESASTSVIFPFLDEASPAFIIELDK